VADSLCNNFIAPGFTRMSFDHGTFELEDRLLLYPLIDWLTHLQVTSLFTPTTPVVTSKREMLCDKDAFNMSAVTALTPH